MRSRWTISLGLLATLAAAPAGAFQAPPSSHATPSKVEPPSTVVDWLKSCRKPASELPRDLFETSKDGAPAPRVVIFGRAANGTSDIARFEAAAWKSAQAAGNFEILAVDVGFAEGLAADEFVKSGKGNAVAIAASFGPWGWSQGDVVDLLETMRRDNQDKSAKRTFAGIGVGSPKLLCEPVFDFVRKAYPEGLPRTERILQPLQTDGRDGRSKYYQSDENDRGMVYAGLDELLSIVRDQAEPMSAKIGAAEYQRGLAYVTAVVQAEQWMRFDLTGSDSDPRGRVLAENCGTLLARASPKARILVLAHARDLGRASDRDSMAAQLATYFQIQPLCIASACGEASFAAYDPNDHTPGAKIPRGFVLDAAGVTPLESALKACGSGNATFDLRRPLAQGPAFEWFAKMRTLRSARPWIGGADEAVWDYFITRDFDAIVWFEHAASASKPASK